MSRRSSYSDTVTGEYDDNIRQILVDKHDGSKLHRILLNIIKNELTSRQKEIIMLYYFKGMNICEIAEMKNITPQAVSAMIIRARKKIFDYMKYIF
ncbi:MAG: sigma-70 region 4 domain-containing protein [Ruminococcus sp.]|nr:sigma-70 region 4 domain-containing protein [Ruminococcus sp.]MDE6785193.1 sigma-70 region 4 domain-containing protein [Ruminococcus sp.]